LADLGHAHPKCASRRHAVDVKLSVGDVIGIKREAEQSFFAGGSNIGHGKERSRGQHPGGKIQDTNLPTLLDDEQSIGITGRRGDKKRRAQTRGNANRVRTLNLLRAKVVGDDKANREKTERPRFRVGWHSPFTVRVS
jgi:hypothetical protein